MSTRTCSFSGCGRDHRSNGLCNAHNVQRLRGKPLTPLRAETRVCAYDGCFQTSRRWLCKDHQLDQGTITAKKTDDCGCPWPKEGRFCGRHRAMFWQQTQLRVTERLRA